MAKKDYFEEYFAPDQGVTQTGAQYDKTIGTNNKRPREARRIWKTLNSVEGWVKYSNDGHTTDAIAGLLVTVIGDGDNNGVYMITYADPVNAFYQSEADASGIIRANAAYNTTLGLVKVADAHNINGLVGTQIVADSLNLDDNPSIDPGHYVISTEERKLVDANSVMGTPTATYTIAPGDAPAMASDVKAYVDATSVLQESITVMGDGAGNMTNGKIFEAGITLAQALRQIFVQEIMTKAYKPTITFNANNGTYTVSTTQDKTTVTNNYVCEIGTSIPDLTLGTVISDGYYYSANTEYYSDSNFNNINNCNDGKLYAGCDFTSGPTYSVTKANNITGAVLSDTTVTGFTIINDSVQAQSTTLIPNVTLTVNSVLERNMSKIPKGSLGTDDTDTAYTLNSVVGNANISFIGEYKYFYGCCEYRDDANYTGVIATQEDLNNEAKFAKCVGKNSKWGWCETKKSGSITAVHVGTMEGVGTKSTIMLIIPSDYSHTKHAVNWQGGEVGWTLANELQYTNNGITKTYNVYYIATGSPLPYNEIYFNKNNQ